jgi:glycosyltransferase involved in cell wall biosynthesis
VTAGLRPVRLLAYTGATEWGGAEIVLGHLLANLGAHVQPILMGVDADVVTRIAARRPSMPWSLVPRVSGKRDLGAIWAQRSAIAAAKPDVVQINLPVPFAEPYTVLAALTVPRAQVVVVEHLPMAIKSPRMRLLKRLTSPRLAAHVAVSSRAARQVEQLSGLPDGSIRSIPNGVPMPESENVRRSPASDFVVGAVGRFHQQKAFDVLIRAVAQLPGVQLVLVGEGEQRIALERLAADLGIADRVVLTGWSEEAAAHLRSFDVVAIPSRFEGLPLVLLEAMLTGSAIVATGVGSILDALADGETGLVVPVDDPDALAAALRRLREDPDLRLRLGTAAAEVARSRFTATAMARAYERLYEGILTRSRSWSIRSGQ